MPETPFDRENWLRALNNACNLAIQHQGDDAARLALARRAVSFGSLNVAIFHNAACVFCAVGALDEAVDAVAAAVDHGYGSATMVDDPDLDAIRHTDDFADAIGAARDADEAAHRRQLAKLQAELFAGAPVPDDLSRVWRRQLDIAQARGVDGGGIDALYEEPEHPELDRPEPALDALIAATDWAAGLHPPTRSVGYFRGADGGIAPADAPVVSIDPSGDLWVTADLYDQLRLNADGDAARMQALGELLVMLRIEDTDPNAEPVRERAVAAQAIVDAFLAGH